MGYVLRASRLFGTNGIRGVVGKTLTVDLAYRVGSSIGVLYPRQRVMVGRDGRSSSLMLMQGLIGALLAQGNIVEDCGLITTPGLQFLVRHSAAAAAVMVTASHNPPEYNGFKVIHSDGIELDPRRQAMVEKLVDRNQWRINRHPGQKLTRAHPLEPYFAQLETLVKNRHVARSYRIVVDVGNGVAALTTPVLLRRVGCHVVTLNDNIDGRFSGRLSEPRPENLSALAALVKSEKADFGVAHDGDGDRAVFVDETGFVHSGDRSLALIEDEVLKDNRGGKLVTPVNSSMALSEIAKKRHGKIVLTRVGSIEVSRTMVREKAILGGEENGGIFYSPHHPVRDGTMATILVLNALTDARVPLSKLMARLPRFFMVKEKIPCLDREKDSAMARLRQKLGRRISNTVDGVKVDLPGGWLLVRPSGTEPLVRMYVEASTEEELGAIIAEFRPLVLDSIKH
ncbi:MAG TPA: phosphoglucosamine mutase [Candidatus Bathyarchaeia archaeon]|nr:phosphoglucosamine mutase [Candidatus Bathyarchaeia archaeon]